MEKVIADTGFVVALANQSDSPHHNVKNIYLESCLISDSYIIAPRSPLSPSRPPLKGGSQRKYFLFVRGESEE